MMHAMEALQSVYTEAADRLMRADPSQISVLCGLDGFVDQLARVVDQRKGGEVRWVETLEALGRRIQEAAGKSTNLEWVPLVKKLGGNGPIMAQALSNQGFAVRYVGMLGRPLHPVFEPFARQTPCFSVGEPGETLALEFQDGKLILGQMQSLSQLDRAALESALGPGAWRDLLACSQVLALTNWTMLPHLGEVLEHLLQSDLPALASRPGVFFFDLADPAKRTREALQDVLTQIARFQSFGRVFLGLNLKEAQQVAQCLGCPTDAWAQGQTWSGLVQAQECAHAALASTAELRQKLGIDTVVVHARAWACAAAAQQSAALAGPFCPQPRWTTGAGDHFNAGFLAGQLLALPLAGALAQAMATSGYYVRQGISPSLPELLIFLKSCLSGIESPLHRA